MRRARVLRILVPALLAGSAMAGENPTNVRLADMDARLSRVERLVDNEGLMSLMKQLEQLQKENQALQNDVENLQHEAQLAAARQKDQYVDIDRRLQAMERGSAANAAAAGEAGAVLAGGGAAGGGGDKAAYQAAFDLLKEGHYAEANAALRQFMVSYPDSALSDNAHYWYAESFYVGQTYDKALPAFQTMIDKYPQSRKIPDALLKIGYCNFELKRYDAARKALQSVVTTYPESPAAKLARQRLDRMKSEGI